MVLSARLHADAVALCCAAEKSSIYTYPGAILPVLNPLMKALAHLFPDKGITQVTARLLHQAAPCHLGVYSSAWHLLGHCFYMSDIPHFGCVCAGNPGAQGAARHSG